MTRKALNAFRPDKLGIGQSKSFEVRNPQTGFKQVHYFYRDADGELFKTVCQNTNAARKERDQWLKAKRQRSNTGIFLEPRGSHETNPFEKEVSCGETNG